MEILSGKGLTIMEFQGEEGNTVWNFQRQGGLKHESHLWLGVDIFWNRPFLRSC